VITLAALHIQPLFINYEIKSEQVAKSTCHKQKSCQKKKDPLKEKKDCTNQGCNPFVPCSVGMCCYVVENFFTPSGILIYKKQKLTVIDDNTLSKGLSECWHPPESVS